MADTPKKPDPKDSPSARKRQISLDNGRIVYVEREEDENTRIWTDPNDQIWEVSLYYLKTQAMAAPTDPTDWPLDKLGVLHHIRFRDHKRPDIHASVPYTSDKSVWQLTEKEMLGHWKQAF